MRNIVVAFTIAALLPFGGAVTSLQAISTEAQSICRLSTNAARACRIVNELGIGQHVEATLIRGERIRGEIRHIADDHFVVILHGTVTPLAISYEHVRKLRPLGQQTAARARRSWLRVAHGAILVAMYVLYIAECDKSC